MKLLKYLYKRSKPFYIATGVILVFLLGFADYKYGYETSFSIFYLFPVIFVTWYRGKASGFIISFLSAVTWLIADLASGHSYSNYIIPVWNAMVRLGYFSIVCYLLAFIHRDIDDIKSSIYKGADKSGVYRIAKKQKEGAIALFYHGVEKKITNPLLQELHMPFSLFEKQIMYLKKNFEIISVDDLYGNIKNGHGISPSQVVVTFDDGYKNNINIVAPFLQAYNIPFSVYISTSHVSNGSKFSTYYLRTAILYTEQQCVNIPSLKMEVDISSQEKRISAINDISKIMKRMPQKTKSLLVKDMINLLPHDRWLELNNIFSSDDPMNWDEIKKLHESGVIIGSHCHDHTILHDGQSNEEIDYQLKTSKELIEKHLGACRYFVYPNGGKNLIKSDSILSVKKNGYLLGFTTVRGEISNGVNQYILPRLSGYDGYGQHIDSFKFQMNTASRFNRSYNKWCRRILSEKSVLIPDSFSNQ